MFKEIGKYKETLQKLFIRNDDICTILLDGIEDDEELEKYIIPHLYVDDVIKDSKSYIMYDVFPTNVNKTIANLTIVIQVICHKNIVKYRNKKETEYGLRYDILSHYIENLLCPTDKNLLKTRIEEFGIGEFEIIDNDLFLSKDFIGRVFKLNVPDFR